MRRTLRDHVIVLVRQSVLVLCRMGANRTLGVRAFLPTSANLSVDPATRRPIFRSAVTITVCAGTVPLTAAIHLALGGNAHLLRSSKMRDARGHLWDPRNAHSTIT